MSTPLRRRAALVPPLLALAALLPTAAPAAAAPPPAAWALAAPLPAAVRDASSAQLGDGDVLVFGGATSFGAGIDASARFDAATGTWAATGAMVQTLSGEGVVTLADGRVLMSGGNNFGAKADAAVFDPQTDAWTAVAPMTAARYEHSLTLLADGTVLAAGGRDGTGTYLGSAERYDPVRDRWTAVGAMPSPHALHTATRLADGSVVVVGGREAPDVGSGIPTAAVTRFDPASESWAPQPALPRARGGHTTTLLEGGSLVVVGGDAGAMQPTLRRAPDGSWSALGTTAFTRPETTLLDGGLLLVTSGTAATLLDTRDGTAARIAAAPVNRVDGALLRLPDGPVLRVGGAAVQGNGGFTEAVADVERFDPRARALTAPADFGEQTTGRRSATVTIPVTAVGDVPLFVRGVTIEGAAAADYAITADGCTDAVLEEGESCFVGVRFTPGADGARAATLAVAAPLLDGGRQLVALTGDGVPAPAIPEIPRTPETPTTPESPAPTPAGQQPAPTPNPTPNPDPTPTPTPAARRPAARRPAATPQLRCSTRRPGRRVTCTGAPRSLGAGAVRLSRNGTVHATGTLKRGKLTLTVSRRLAAGSYTLAVGKRSLRVTVA